MGRHSSSQSYIAPLKSDGTSPVPASGADATVNGRGVYTLASGTTYFFPLGIADAPVFSVHLQHDAAIAITSAAIEDCNFAESEVPWYNDTAGTWFTEDPSTAYVATDGANTTATQAVVAVTAGAVGGAMWHVADNGAKRARLKVVVGATGGEVRVAMGGKE